MSEEEILEAKLKLAIAERGSEEDSSFEMTDNGLFSEDCAPGWDPLPEQEMANALCSFGIGFP